MTTTQQQEIDRLGQHVGFVRARQVVDELKAECADLVGKREAANAGINDRQPSYKNLELRKERDELAVPISDLGELVAEAERDLQRERCDAVRQVRATRWPAVRSAGQRLLIALEQIEAAAKDYDAELKAAAKQECSFTRIAETYEFWNAKRQWVERAARGNKYLED